MKRLFSMREEITYRPILAFVALSPKWRASLPLALRREDPLLLLRILAMLELADEGLSQADLRNVPHEDSPKMPGT